MLEDAPKIDRTIPIPLYYQLRERILNEIKSGNYKPNSMIPTEIEISKIFNLSRTTVRQAINQLVQEGWLYRIKSKGTFVGSPKISQDFIKKIASYNETITKMGMKPSTELLSMEKIPASKVSSDVLNALKLNNREKIISIFRRRFADDIPMVTVQTYLPYNLCKDVMNHDLNKEQLYSILSENSKTGIFRIERTVEAIPANDEDADLLSIQKGDPLQYTVSIGYNAYNDPIEFSIARYRGDRSKFEVTVFP
jgi:GntR family transcriptional regulator